MLIKTVWSQLKIDIPLMVMLFVLAAFGLVILYSASNSMELIIRQIQHFVIAFAAMLMIAQIPTKGVSTLYSRFGDWFGWANCILSFVFIAAVLFRR